MARIRIGLIPWGVPLALASSLLVASCEEQPPSSPQEVIRADPYSLNRIPPAELWYTDQPPLNLDTYTRDEEGVHMFEKNGELYYFPTRLAQTGMRLLDNYLSSGEAIRLELSIRHAERLLKEGVEVDGALFFPVNMEFELHGLLDDLMPVPWYSGMSQGQALSFFLRLYRTTGDERYMTAARRIFPTFLRFRDRHQPFIVEMDDSGYYWIEEYPKATRNQVLNGFVFGLFGLFEYYQDTGDETALRLVRAGLTTLRHYANEYRVPGEASYYCLRHRGQYSSYHAAHIRLMRELYRMCGDPFFEEFAGLLEADYP
jgi:hypothetical protein